MAMKYRLKHNENGNLRYTQLQGKCSDDSDDEYAIPLQTKKETPTMDYDIEADDTLQAIALRFHCTIAELKRLNNIHRENEIFARRSIRVPIRPHSVLTELIVGVHISGNSSPTKNITGQLIDIDTQTLEEKLKSGTSHTIQPSSDLTVLNSLIFNSKVSDVDVTNQVEQIIEDENVTLLPNLVETQPPTFTDRLKFSGDDCGFSWLVLVVLIILLGVVCPLIYVLYIAEHPEQFHHH